MFDLCSLCAFFNFFQEKRIFLFYDKDVFVGRWGLGANIDLICCICFIKSLSHTGTVFGITRITQHRYGCRPVVTALECEASVLSSICSSG